jgi:hypothetical protein
VADSIVQGVLDRIASGESPDYSTIYGGQKFSDFTDHPRVYVPIQGDPDGRKSSAAGRYQFLASTWDAQAKKLGLKDFGPESQDSAAWDLARTSYLGNTGRDLYGDAKAGKVDWKALAGQWPSLNRQQPPLAGHLQQAVTGLGGGAVPPPASGESAPGGLGLLALAGLAPKVHFIPVDYDPFVVAKAGAV